MLCQAQTLRGIMEMAQKVEDQSYILQKVQGFKFESGRGSASNKQVGFKPNYHLVADIIESCDSRAGEASRNTDSLMHTTIKSTSFKGTALEKSELQFKTLSDSEFG